MEKIELTENEKYMNRWAAGFLIAAIMLVALFFMSGVASAQTATPPPATAAIGIDMGVNLTDTTGFATTTLTGFGPIVAAFIGLGMALVIVRKFVRR